MQGSCFALKDHGRCLVPLLNSLQFCPRTGLWKPSASYSVVPICTISSWTALNESSYGHNMVRFVADGQLLYIAGTTVMLKYTPLLQLHTHTQVMGWKCTGEMSQRDQADTVAVSRYPALVNTRETVGETHHRRAGDPSRVEATITTE